jgi:hypothetical protein
MKFIILFILFLNNVRAHELGAILKRNNGTVLYTTQPLAHKRCQELGFFLPTFRQYAEEAVTSGAKIRESNFKGVNSNNPKVSQEIIQNLNDGYELQTAYLVTTGQEVVDYYYNPSNYKKTAQNSDDSCFWTTTPAIDYGVWSFTVFCNRDGRKSTAEQSSWLAVRCTE